MAANSVADLYTVSINDTGVAHYNFNAHQPILIIFGRHVAERVCYQMVICHPTSPNWCLCTTWGNINPGNRVFSVNDVLLWVVGVADEHLVHALLPRCMHVVVCHNSCTSIVATAGIGDILSYAVVHSICGTSNPTHSFTHYCSGSAAEWTMC